MTINIPKKAIATHPVKKTIDGVSKYTPVIVKLKLDDENEKSVAAQLKMQLDSGEEREIRIMDNQTLSYSFNGRVKEVRSTDGVVVLEVTSPSVHYPREE